MPNNYPALSNENEQFEADLAKTEQLCGQNDAPDVVWELYDKLIAKYPNQAQSWLGKAQRLTWNFTQLDIPNEVYAEVCRCMEKACAPLINPFPEQKSQWERYRASYIRFKERRHRYIKEIRRTEAEAEEFYRSDEQKEPHAFWYALYLSAVWIAVLVLIFSSRNFAPYASLGGVIATVFGGVLHQMIKTRAKARFARLQNAAYSLPGLRAEYETFLKNSSILK